MWHADRVQQDTWCVGGRAAVHQLVLEALAPAERGAVAACVLALGASLVESVESISPGQYSHGKVD